MGVNDWGYGELGNWGIGERQAETEVEAEVEQSNTKRPTPDT